jgi:succinoglycan biosynthesis protein ExoA
MTAPDKTCLIVVPTLNEARHIGGLIEGLLPEAEALGALIVVADGGSRDGTLDIVAEQVRHSPLVRLLHNPKRIQSAAINLAVDRFGADIDYVIRIDAHGAYPADYCRVLVREAQEKGVDSVVVPMKTVGMSLFQRAVATAQNSVVGTGGSEHRTGRAGRFVSHGHHALMSIPAYRAVGGYDESFRHNEDAELDFRLTQAGFRIWLTDETTMTYYPRASVSGLSKQYFGYGRGRARNLLKHRMRPRLRQMLPLAIAPAAVLAPLAVVHWTAAVPLALWIAACLGLGMLAALQLSDRYKLPPQGAPLVGISAMIMQFAWSTGFWLHLAQSLSPRKEALGTA